MNMFRHLRKGTAAVMTAVMLAGLFTEAGVIDGEYVYAADETNMTESSDTETPTNPAETEKIVEEVTFSHESGYYENEFNLTLTDEKGRTIYYTTDGSDPKLNDSSTFKYTGPIRVTDLKGSVFLSNKENSYSYAENIEDTLSGDKFWVYEPEADKIDRAFIVRAIAVDPLGQASPISTRTYFVNNNIAEKYKGTAVMSLVTDPDNLLDPDTGIYVLGNDYKQYGDFRSANFMRSGKDSERAANMEFFNGTNTADISRGVGIRIHGGYSRRNQQKSMNIYFRDTYDYGTKNLKKYELIPGLKKYANVMIRNGGNDADYTKFQDAFIQGQVANLNVGTQLTRPCMVYLNGEFWGLYGLTEKYSDNSIQYKYGVDNKNVIIYKDDVLDEGEELDPDRAMHYEFEELAYLDMTEPDNYKRFCDIVDIDNYIDYNATEVYIDNGDWWSGCTNIHNHMMWRVADPSAEMAVNPDNKYGDGKWRFCLFDTEYSMDFLNDGGHYYSYSAWNRDSIKDHLLAGDRVFAAAFHNQEFADKFMTRLLDLRNYLFEYYNAANVIDNYVELYNPLMQMHKVRWGYEDMDKSVRRMKTFLAYRGDYALNMIEKNFDVTSADRVNVSVSQNLDAACAVTVNDMTPIQNREWKAVYYKNNKLRLTAKDEVDCRFDHWEVKNAVIDNISSAEAVVTLNNSGDAAIKAVYVNENGEEYDPGPTVEPTTAPSAVPSPSIAPSKRPVADNPWEDDKPRPSVRPQQSARPQQTPPICDATPEASRIPDLQPTPTIAPDNKSAAPSPAVTQLPQQTAETDREDIQDLLKIYTVGKGKYRLDGKGGVILTGTKKKTLTSFTIPANVKIEGNIYKVVEIAKNTFKNCKKLKRINVKSLTIKRVGSSAFKNIFKKAVIKVPKAEYKRYKKLFKGKGQKKTVIIR